MLQDRAYYIIFRLITRLFGLFLTAFSFIFTLALFSFDPNDPSFDTVSTDDLINNWIGSFGSHIADLAFQLIGLSAFFLCLIIFSIGFKMMSRNGIRNFLPKIIITPFCILCLSIFFSTIPQPSWWDFNSLGGVNGRFILSKLGMPNFLAGVTFFLASLVLISLIIEVSFLDWKYFFRYMMASARYFFTNIAKRFKTKKIEEIKTYEEENIEEEEKAEVVKKAVLKKKLQETKTKKIAKPKKSTYQLPDIELLTDRSAENKNKKTSKETVDNQSKMLSKVMEDFGVYGNVLGAKIGPVVTLHEFEPSAGTKASRVIGLADDIARSMSAVSARIAVIAGKTSIGIELPNLKREMIFLRELIECKDYRFSQNALPMILGKDIAGETVIADLAKMPHLLIAGTTGSGKSVGLNVMILSLLYKLRPDECKFIMIDPKMLELSIYDGIPHLLAPVVTEPGKAVIALKWVVAEMEERYRLMSSFSVRNIAGYNEKAEKAISNGEKLSRKVQTGYDPSTGQPIVEEIEFEPKKLPFIVVIVDEMADLMLVAGKEIENSVQRLAQMARAAGIHIIMATQRPSVDVITGVIKANFPTRISFQVTSRIDSRTILGVQGAEQLLGQGDMIYMSGGSKMMRVHGPFCSDVEIENIVNFIKSQDLSEFSESEKISFEVPVPSSDAEGDAGGFEEGSDGDLYNKAVAVVRRDKKPSISYLQRQFRIGYNRAATLIEKMEQEGIVSAPSVSGRREVIED